MKQSPMIKFDNDTAKTREKYKIFQGMKSRTIRALWEALGEGYAQLLEYQLNAVLQAEFELALAAKKMRTGPNKVLLVTEYIYFPRVLHPGKGHRADINKASLYAAAYDKALALNIRAADFVSFVQKNGGLQKIATGGTPQPKRQTKGSPTGKRAARKTTTATLGASTVVQQPGLSFPGLAGDVCYSNAAVAAKAAKALEAAENQRQTIVVVIYADGEESVVVGVSSTPCTAPTPVRNKRVR